jgi:hypothetical protein
MPLDKRVLIDFLSTLDDEINGKITIVAAGGTAMTLLDLKPSTIDIDFTIPSEDRHEFGKALTSMPHGFKVDVWSDGQIFSQILPNDYLKKSIEIVSLKHILLRALHPVDIIVTKIGRLDEKDLQDIEACIEKFHISKIQVEERAADVQYVGKEENYIHNLKCVLERFF